MKLDMNCAGALVAAATKGAQECGVAIAVAVVDEGGHLVAFFRMDDAPIISVDMAIDKAFTAVALKLETSALAELIGPGAALYGLESYRGGRIVPIGGGVPIAQEARIVGGVGVSGGTPSEDMAIARGALEIESRGGGLK